MGTSTEYYRKNAAARKKKAATDKKINAKPAQVKKRVESNAARRKAKAKGQNINNRDYDHAVKKFVPVNNFDHVYVVIIYSFTLVSC